MKNKMASVKAEEEHIRLHDWEEELAKLFKALTTLVKLVNTAVEKELNPGETLIVKKTKIPH